MIGTDKITEAANSHHQFDRCQLISRILRMQIFGNFVEELPESEEYLVISFSPSSEGRQQRWRNYGLSADFLGDYFANFFPGEVVPSLSIDKQETVKASVSYIANELLENAMKFSQIETKIPVNISLYLYDTQLVFVISNTSDVQTSQRYQTFIQKILESNIEELYIQQLENIAAGSQRSGMGLLTMIHDYSVDFGWKFEPFLQMSNLMKVTVMAYLTL